MNCLNGFFMDLKKINAKKPEVAYKQNYLNL
jgi:hypothetical protein